MGLFGWLHALAVVVIAMLVFALAANMSNVSQTSTSTLNNGAVLQSEQVGISTMAWGEDSTSWTGGWAVKK